MPSKARNTVLAMTVLVAGIGLSACSGKRWCELDATDQKVADRYCEAGTPGYEWEPDSDKKKKSKKTKKRS
ncbi:hypothetical protein [Spirillospora sp. NPDC047279]|uniref:hypothetical protein n=1 Tax=Spirillospora sp. NPDC047279 TaxID=3155478 RepID=UPI0033FB9987